MCNPNNVYLLQPSSILPHTNDYDSEFIMHINRICTCTYSVNVHILPVLNFWQLHTLPPPPTIYMMSSCTHTEVLANKISHCQ